MAHEYMIHMYPSGLDTCSSAKKPSDLAQIEWWCRASNAPRLDARSIDFQIAEKRPVHFPLSSAAYSEVCFATKTLLKQIGEYCLEGELFLGNLVGPNGTVFPDWATFRCRHRTIVRGSDNVSCRICEGCGNVHYFAVGRKYICLPHTGHPLVMQSQFDGIVLAPELFEKVNVGAKKNFRSRKLRF